MMEKEKSKEEDIEATEVVISTANEVNSFIENLLISLQ